MKNFDLNINATVRSLVNGGISVTKQKLFAGAGVIVSLPDSPVDENMNLEGKICLVSKYAKEISRLIFEFKDALGTSLDCVGRYEFYAALANAEIAYIDEHGDDDGVLEAVANAGLEFAHDNRYSYFAYGSNMEINQMANRCEDAQLAGLATLEGYELAADSAGYLTIVRSEGSHVDGAAWKVSLCDIVELDYYEGVASGCYSKEFERVQFGADECSMLVYISLRDTCTTSDNAGYMARVIAAAEELGVDDSTMAQLRNIAS